MFPGYSGYTELTEIVYLGLGDTLAGSLMFTVHLIDECLATLDLGPAQNLYEIAYPLRVYD